MREIVFDTETTGFKPEEGHRLVEIGCVELENHLPTGRHKQWYINPERDVPKDATRVHGLTIEFLSNHPIFAAIAGEFLEFIGDAPLIAHNASFDMGFINNELKLANLKPLSSNRKVTDTVKMARDRFPGAQASLDALCKRFSIDNSGRSFHGALLDVTLLAEVYLELLGGRQTGFVLATTVAATPGRVQTTRTARPARPHAASATELARHQELIKKLKSPVWLSE